MDLKLFHIDSLINMIDKFVADEFNPLRDMDGMGFECEHYYNPKMDPEKSIKESYNNIQRVIISLIKPVEKLFF